MLEEAGAAAGYINKEAEERIRMPMSLRKLVILSMCIKKAPGTVTKCI